MKRVVLLLVLTLIETALAQTQPGVAISVSPISALPSFSPPVVTCAQNLAVGSYTLCGEAYNDVTSGTSVSVNYAPTAGNGIVAWGTWCCNSSCNSSTAGVTATLGDNVNATESCFVASPHSPFLTDANAGAQGSGDFQQHYIWYCPSISPGVTSFTMTPSSANLSYLQLNISEWNAGALAASCSPVSACFENVDNLGQAGTSTGGTTATLATSGPTLNADDLIFAVTEVPCCSFLASPGLGYTGITVAPSLTVGMVSEAQAVTATGVQTATSSWTGGSASWSGVIVPIKAVGALPVVAAPSFSPGTGAYSSGPTVTIRSATSGAILCYTTDGSIPAAATPGTCSTGATLANGGTVTVSTAETLAALATESGFTNSAVASASYTISAAITPIRLVQDASQDAGPTTSSSLAFTSNNTAGNWIAVCIRAGASSSQIFTVSDSQGNTYLQAVQLGVTGDTPNGNSLAIYYAQNINRGANTVTVSDTVSGSLRLAIFEYSGVATSNSLDVTASVQGTSTSPNSWSITTTANGDLLLGVIDTADPETFTAGSGYVAEQLVPAEPGTKLLVEDQIQATAGAASASATLGASDPWGALLAAFKAGSYITAPPAASITISPTSASLVSNGTQQFTATVSGSSNPAVTWSATGGTVSTSGLYTAPNSAGTYTVTVTSTANPSASAAATVTVAAPVQHTVTLSWAASTATVSGYNIYRGTVSGGPYTQINTALDATTSYVDSTVQSGQTYYYVTTAVSAAGVESAYSNQAVAIVPLP